MNRLTEFKMNSRAPNATPIFKNRNQVPHRNFAAFAGVICNHEAEDRSRKTTDARQALRIISSRSNGQFNEPTSTGKAKTERKMPKQQLQADEKRSPPVEKTDLLEQKKLAETHKTKDEKGMEGLRQVPHRPVIVVKKHPVIVAKAGSLLEKKQRVSQGSSSRPKVPRVLGKEKAKSADKRSSNEREPVTDEKKQPSISRKTELQYHR